MKTILFIFIAITSILSSCNQSKKIAQPLDGLNNPIQIAISDFLTTSKQRKKYTVFRIWNFGLVNNKDIIVVTISGNEGKMLLTKDCIIGSKGKLPSRFIEQNGKLFFWWDDDYPLTEKTLLVLKKYNLLQDDQNGTIRLLESRNDDLKKATHYYLCKNLPFKYKKIFTNIGVGYYEPPKLNCSDE